MRRSRDLTIAAVWGFAEATLFFVVPDVWLGWLALRQGKLAWQGMIAALLGAVIGGILVAGICAEMRASTSAKVMDAIPAISGSTIQDVDMAVQRDGSKSMLEGPVKGTPYKLYARAIGIQEGGPTFGFVGWSIVARALRWVIVIPLFLGSAAAIRRWTPLSERRIRMIYAAFWIAFYAWYLASKPW